MKRLIVLLSAAFATAAWGQGVSVVNSAHNLSASGPGSVRAASEQEVCIFCHTPHHAAPIQPLWNRREPMNAYTVYSSNSLDASPGQPTGSSKLCLSCHDGTIALGSVVSRNQPIQMAGGMTTLPPGRSNLGTDLSDDHPVSFRYTADLATRDPKLRSPMQLPPGVRLDANGEMQCTTCHDAHDNRNGRFLVMANEQSQLCGSCHQPGATTVAGHTQCSGCHQPHSAPSGPYLLKAATASETCLSCHSGQPGGAPKNIGVELAKLSRHDTNKAVNLEATTAEVGCADCHEPHTMAGQAGGRPPALSPRLGQVSGVSETGVAVKPAQFEYQVCFKCHAENSKPEARVSRQIAQTNTRLEFASTAISYHPVVAAGRNPNVPSLVAGMDSSTIIACTSCHTSDTGPSAGGSGAEGPHASNTRPLLRAGYATADRTPESSAAYALCYTCHQRTSILEDRSFTKHKQHIVDERTPCSVCHDPHGVSSAQGTAAGNARLMNFDITVVQPTADGRLEYQNTGNGSGRCYLSCHGKVHNPLSY